MKVTEKNMSTVMGHINRFLAKDTKEYVGIRKHQVGTETKNFMGSSFEGPIYEDKPTYVPFIGKCKVHHIRTEVANKMKEGKHIFSHDMHSYHHVLLAMVDNYCSNCIPIKAGFEVTITGNMMVIKENDVYFETVGFTGKISRMKVKEKSTYRYFYHMPISAEEKEEKIRSGIYAMDDLADQAYYCEDISDSYPEWISSSIRNLHSDFNHQISEAIKKIDLNEKTVSIPLYIEEYVVRKKNIALHINVEKLRNGISQDNEAYYFSYGDKKFYELYSLIVGGVLAADIKEYYENRSKAEECYAGYDYDYDFLDEDF